MNNENTEVFSLIEKSQKILVIPAVGVKSDTLCASFAFCQLLATKQKKAYLLLSSNIPQKLDFLQKPTDIKKDLIGSRDLLLIFNTHYNKITNVETKNNPQKEQYTIRITPERGSIDPKDFSFVPAEFRYDLLVILGAPTLDSLGEIYQKNTELFFEVPKVNIDHHSNNENYGQANVTDMTAACTSEVCANLFMQKAEPDIDKSIAQSLLTGIIAATESFQTPTTSPRTMITAAGLMKFKADQPTIIRHLYKTKSLSFLKLWGRVMANLKWNETKKVAWANISMEDFIQSRSTEKDVPFILEEVQKNFGQGKIFAVFYAETSVITRAQIKFADPEQAKRIAKEYNIEPTEGILRIRFEDKDVEKSQNDFLEKI